MAPTGGAAEGNNTGFTWDTLPGSCWLSGPVSCLVRKAAEGYDQIRRILAWVTACAMVDADDARSGNGAYYITMNSRNSTKTMLLTAACVLAIFVACSQALKWFTLNQRDFSIPLRGDRHLTSNDAWQSQLEVLLRDMTAYWTEVLSAQGLTYRAPELVAGFEGPRPVCESTLESRAPFYCPSVARVDVNRILFNGISRQAPLGMNHLAVSYAFAHLVGHHVQAVLGTPVQAIAAGGSESRRDLELQADCIAGMWLQNATSRFGPATSRDLGRVVARVHMGSVDEGRPVPDGLVEDLDLASVEDRIASVRRGFQATSLSACHPFRR